MWETGNNPKKVFENVNAKMLALEGELTDEVAQATLAEFLYANPGLMLELVAGIRLKDIQEIVLRGWLLQDYNMAVWGRGSSKSFLCAIFCLVWALFNPGNRIVIVSFAFRASRRILEQIEKFVNDKDAALLKNCFPKDLQRKTDEWKWVLPNGAQITCLPLGDGVKLRSTRADTIIIDERNYVNDNVINEVILPFMASSSNMKEQMKIDEYENELIREGKMTEDQRTKLDEAVKVIHLSSAGFQFEPMYAQYNNWIANIRSTERTDRTSYFVSRLSWEALPDGMINLKTIQEAQSSSSESSFDREYKAIFTSDSSGYFKATKLAACSVKDGETPCLELKGDKDSEYVVAIDVSLSSSDSSDYFAICVMKIVERPSDKMRVGMVVHSYAVAGGNMKDHILYFYYLLTNFNVVYVGIDASQGDEVEFINSCVQSQLFKQNRLDLHAIEADFKGTDFSELPRQIRQSYNRTIGRIVQKQTFSSAWQRAANEYLQGCLDHSRIYFAGKIAANSTVAGRMMDADMTVLHQHEEFKDMGPAQFVEHQDYLLDLTRKQCTMIENKISTLGTVSYDLPQNLKRMTGPNRPRKDLYSALLLCNYCVHMYVDSQGIQVQTGPSAFPYALVG